MIFFFENDVILVFGEFLKINLFFFYVEENKS